MSADAGKSVGLDSKTPIAGADTQHKDPETVAAIQTIHAAPSAPGTDTNNLPEGSDADTDNLPGDSFENANLFTRWTFGYMNRLISRGVRRELHMGDFPAIEKVDESGMLSSALLQAWRDEVSARGANAHLVRAIFRVFGVHFAKAGIAFLIEAMVVIGEGIVLGEILKWFQQPSASSETGYYYAAILVVLTFIHSIIHHIEFFLAMRSGLQLRIALIAAIYRKCLALSIGHTSSTGFIVNIVSNDVQRCEDAAIFGHFAWVGPIQIIVAAYFVYLEIGLATIAAIGALLLFIPLQSVFAAQFAKLRRFTVMFRDERIKSISDMLAGIMVVKLYAWEDPFVSKIASIRDKEMVYIERASIYRAINEALFFLSSTFLELFGFMTFRLIGGVFTPSRIFTTLTYLQGVRLTMTNFFPKALQFGSEALVSLQRIQAFLSLPEIDHSATSEESAELLRSIGDDSVMVFLDKASFSWSKPPIPAVAAPQAAVANTASQQTGAGLAQHKQHVRTESERIVLENISLRLRSGELMGVCGPVGAGKTSLVNAILGELNRTNGNMALRSRKIGYAGQTPWIVSGSIRDNILFGSKYDPKRFAAVLRACALNRDLERFPRRELTMIGERGVTLSGGQRARLALARALYYDADIYILDDPLSAVDTVVGRHLFEEALRGLLRNKAVFLVTHQLQHIRACDTVILIEDGRIVKTGTYDQVMTSDTPFASTLREYDIKDGDVDEDVANESEAADTLPPANVNDGQSNHTTDGLPQGPIPAENSSVSKVDGNDAMLRKRRQEREIEVALEEDAAPQSREIVKEDTAKGSVTLGVYAKYFRYGSNTFVALFLVLLLILGEAAVVMTDWWLARWSVQSPEDQGQTLYMATFLGLVAAAIVISMVRAIIFFIVCLRASKKSFRSMLSSVFRSPMHFFQINPHGRVMNRFSKDMSLMDEMLPMTMFDFVQCFFIVIGTFVIAVVAIPYVVIFIPIVATAFYYLRKYFIMTSRQIKRLESVTRSPVYSDVSTTLEGLATIRAFSAEDRIQHRFFGLQNENTRVFFMFVSANRWLGFRLDMMSSTFLSVITFGAILLRVPLGLNPGTVGLMLSYGLQLTGTLQWCARQSAEVENLMVSAERVFEYTELPSEAAAVTDVTPGPKWPEHGDVQITDMSMAYPILSSSPAAVGADGTSVAEPNTRQPVTVLKNITIHFEPGTKVGIVGRSGAGKSSFLQALFRLVEPSPPGSIVIDGIKTSDLGLRDLRSRISIIPQDPFCFKGTLRFNLDPFGRHTDDELWRVLEAVELKSTVSAMPARLESEVAENGGNWSVGERQLICLARAILRNTRLIVMDEATSAVDLRTDQLVQHAIRSQGGMFADATVLTIAHRLNTVIDFDFVMVLDDGRVVEYGAPYELLDKPPSASGAWFSRMVSEMGDEARAGLVQIANRARPASTKRSDV